jgi:hypothetical protein
MVYDSLFTTDDLSTDALNDIFMILYFIIIFYFLVYIYYLFYRIKIKKKRGEMNPQIETYDPFIIIKNEDLINIHSAFGKKWNDFIKKTNPLYIYSYDYPLNRTILYNYLKPDPHIFSLDICTNIATLIVPIKCTVFYDSILPGIIQYLTNHIKSIIPLPQVANEMNYRLYVYIHQNHVVTPILRNHPMILTHPTLYKKSVLYRDLGDQYLQMEIFLHL